MYDLKSGQAVECTWIDPVVASDWTDVKDVKFYKFICTSIGYVHSAGPEGLVLTASYGNDSDGERSLLLQQCLPWECILDLWILEVN